MPLLSDYARKKKIDYFTRFIPKDARILECGCGEGWFGEYLKTHGWANYQGADLFPPADYVGNIKDWRQIGIPENAFDVIIAFEFVEHVNCFRDLFDMLKPGGVLLLTTPVPHMDWFLKILERVGLNQQRMTPHTDLVYIETVPDFERVELKRVAGLAQWAVLRKPAA